MNSPHDEVGSGGQKTDLPCHQGDDSLPRTTRARRCLGPISDTGGMVVDQGSGIKRLKDWDGNAEALEPVRR